jgi:hypothetical protein
MALSNKIWLNEMTRKTADDIIEEIWSSLRDRYETFAGNGNRQSDARSQHANQEIPSSQEQHVKKKINAR